MISVFHFVENSKSKDSGARRAISNQDSK